MTEKEKRFIVEQRVLGATFVEIARALGRTEDSVRCAFNRVVKKGEDVQLSAKKKSTGFCRNCGEPLQINPRGAKRLFCSDRCRNVWGNEKRSRTPYARTCEFCGKRFTAFGNPHKRFCSRQCYANQQKMVPV